MKTFKVVVFECCTLKPLKQFTVDASSVEEARRIGEKDNHKANTFVGAEAL